MDLVNLLQQAIRRQRVKRLPPPSFFTDTDTDFDHISNWFKCK